MTEDKPFVKRRLWATEQCIEDGCTAPPVARNVCTKHYQLHKKQGTLPPKVRRAGVRQDLVLDDCQVSTCVAVATCRGYCRRHYSRSRRYGMTAEELASADAQTSCESCGAPSTHVDHCHDTNEVRGMLCQSCNTSFGLLGEDPLRIAQLLTYALKWRKPAA